MKPENVQPVNREFFKLHHVTQPSAFTCVSACLAMLTDRPVETVVAEFDDLYLKGEINPAVYLIRHGYLPNYYFAHEHNPLEPGNIYMLTVCSPTTQGLFHNLLLDTRDAFGAVLLDPLKGTGKRYYVLPNSPELDEESPEYNELAVPLVSWVVDLSIYFGDLQAAG